MASSKKGMKSPCKEIRKQDEKEEEGKKKIIMDQAKTVPFA